MSIRISKDFAALQADGNVVAQLSPPGGVLWESETRHPARIRPTVMLVAGNRQVVRVVVVGEDRQVQFTVLPGPLQNTVTSSAGPWPERRLSVDPIPARLTVISGQLAGSAVLRPTIMPLMV